MFRTTMTGSWFRTPEIRNLLTPEKTPRGEISEVYSRIIGQAERRAIQDQLHPLGEEVGLDWVSNGEQRKAGYAWFLPNRFAGFSKTERVLMPLLPSFVEEMQESNPDTLVPRQGAEFSVPRIEEKLVYVGSEFARREAEDASSIAKEEGAQRIFLTSPSPGVVTTCFPRENCAYSDHYDYLFSISRELRKEYEAILNVGGVDLQIDAPDLAMGKQRGAWGVDFFEALPKHVDAINESIKGLPRERIRMHYCYGNWIGSHRFDADYGKVLPELARLQAGTIVGEMANSRHEGDALTLEAYLKENSWPNKMNFAIGVIDVKTPLVETSETVALRLQRVASIDGFPQENLLAGTDCGFETFANFSNITYPVALHKLRSLVKGAHLASKLMTR